MPIMIYHSGKLAVFSRECLNNNVAMVAVGFPATNILLARARVCISAAHSQEDLDYALEVIEHVSCLCILKYRLDPEERKRQVELLIESSEELGGGTGSDSTKRQHVSTAAAHVAAGPEKKKNMK